MRFSAALLFPLAASLTIACGDDDAGPGGPTVPLKVMTRNMYLGADLIPVVTARTIPEIRTQVDELWRTVLSTDPAARVMAMADEIIAENPDVVGLQEVELFRQDEPSNFDFANPVNNAATVKFDFLQMLRAALAAKGAMYEQAVVQEYTDVELPGGPENARFDVRLTDRDAILVRTGLTVVSQRAMRFPSFLPFPLPLEDTTGMSKVRVSLLRGVTLVELEREGVRFTVLNTHLEVGGGPGNVLGSLQEGQSRDLLAVINGISGSLVALGDFNSSNDAMSTSSYRTIASRMTDAWTKAPGVDTGNTCCSDLRAPTFQARSRIDIVFYRGNVAVEGAKVIGTDPTKRTASGQWPSDHAGVTASLRVGR